MFKNKGKKASLQLIYHAFYCFPITIVYLILFTFHNGYGLIQDYDDYYKERTFALVIGILVSIVLELIYKKTDRTRKDNIFYRGSAIILPVIYYAWMHLITDNELLLAVNFTVLIFILVMTALWVPAIKARVTFNQTVMIAYQSFFGSLFYTFILAVGLSLILLVYHLLIADVQIEMWLHTLNICYALYGPIHFLSLISKYYLHPNNSEESMESETESQKAFEIPTFLNKLISFIIIPITFVFTLILFLYIIINITGEFWKDSLMESMLMTFSITVILVYLLSADLKNTMVRIFQVLYPKVLLVIVLFQTLASILKTREMGLTYGRYYIILFGIFATIAALIFSITATKKSGLIAPIAIGLALISLLPFVGAFDLSERNQVNRLKQALERNQMLQEHQIVATNFILKKDQEIIINSVRYLKKMNRIHKYPWLSEYRKTKDFKLVFGFEEYQNNESISNYRYFQLDNHTLIPIHGYDYVKNVNFFATDGMYSIARIEHNGKSYEVQYSYRKQMRVVLLEDGKEIAVLKETQFLERFQNLPEELQVHSLEDGTFTIDGESATLTVLFTSVSIDEYNLVTSFSGEGYILIDIKQ